MDKQKKPLATLEMIFLLIAVMPGILLITGGRATTDAQRIFRVLVFVVGLAGFIAVKIRQKKMAKSGGGTDHEQRR